MITFTDEALDDLENIRSWIAVDRPVIAVEKYLKLKAACLSLDQFPYKGRPGKRPETRELSANPWIIVYKIIESDDDRIVQIVKIWHSRQNRSA